MHPTHDQMVGQQHSTLIEKVDFMLLLKYFSRLPFIQVHQTQVQTLLELLEGYVS